MTYCRSYSHNTVLLRISIIGLRTVPYYGYGRNFYGPKGVGISHTRTVIFFLKARTVRCGQFYGRNTVYGVGIGKAQCAMVFNTSFYEERSCFSPVPNAIFF